MTKRRLHYPIAIAAALALTIAGTTTAQAATSTDVEGIGQAHGARPRPLRGRHTRRRTVRILRNRNRRIPLARQHQLVIGRISRNQVRLRQDDRRHLLRRPQLQRQPQRRKITGHLRRRVPLRTPRPRQPSRTGRPLHRPRRIHPRRTHPATHARHRNRHHRRPSHLLRPVNQRHGHLDPQLRQRGEDQDRRRACRSKSFACGMSRPTSHVIHADGCAAAGRPSPGGGASAQSPGSTEPMSRTTEK